MSQQNKIITQKISKTTKRIKSSVEAYLDPENPIKDMWRQFHQEYIDALSKKSSSRFNDYVILSQDYLQFGDIEQIVFHNKARCKELLFCAAATHWIVCQYFDPNGPMTFAHNWSKVNFRSLVFLKLPLLLMRMSQLANWENTFLQLSEVSYLMVYGKHIAPPLCCISGEMKRRSRHVQPLDATQNVNRCC